MHATATAVLSLVLSGAFPQPPQNTNSLPWVSFSADLRVTYRDGTEGTGRFVRDQHGCERQETPTGPQRSPIVSITNWETHRFYQQIKGRWTVRPMKLGPDQLDRPPTRLHNLRKLPEQIEGFDVYEHQIQSRGPEGTSTLRNIVAPELNFFALVRDMPPVGRLSAHNVVLGPQDPALFLPPADALVAEAPGYGGYKNLAVVVLHVAFAGREPVELMTTEERPYPLQMPGGDSLALVTSVVDWARNLVRISVVKLTKDARGREQRTVLDEVEVVLGAAAQTTRLPANMEIAVTRVRDRWQ